MYLMTQFTAVLEQCAIRNKRDVYSVVMVIVKYRKYLQTCLKNSRRVLYSIDGLFLSVRSNYARAQVCTYLL